MTKVLHICPDAKGFGGIWTYISHLLASELAERYSIGVEFYPGPSRGINWRIIRTLQRVISKESPDILHVHGLKTDGFCTALAAKLAGQKRVLMAVHACREDSQFDSPMRRWIVQYGLEPPALRMVDGVYCVSRHLAKKRLIRRNARVFYGVVDNGVPLTSETETTGQTEEARHIFRDNELVGLCACRLTRAKGLHVLKEALRILAREAAVAARVIVAGDGPQADEIRREFQQLVDQGKVVFLGQKKELGHLFRRCHFFVLPSLHENQSYAILEAMAAGKAVITTDVGGNPELVRHGETGLLVPRNDAEALAGAINELTAKHEMRQAMGKAGRARIDKYFNIERLAFQLDEVYQHMLRRFH